MSFLNETPEITDMYVFEKEWTKVPVITTTGDVIGPYLYRNTRNNSLVASHKKPQENKIYSAYDIGLRNLQRISSKVFV